MQIAKMVGVLALFGAFSPILVHAADDGFTLTPDGVWTWYGEPKALYSPESGLNFMGWLKEDGSIEVASYDPMTGEIEATIIEEEFEVDDHAAPSILLRHDGRLLVFYSDHGSNETRCYKSINPYDVSSFEHVADLQGLGTYPNAVRPDSSSDEIYLFGRIGGEVEQAFVKSEDDGDTWTEARQIFEGLHKPYYKYGTDGKGAIHVAMEIAKRGMGRNTYYCCFKNGAFYRADGTKIQDWDGTPLDVSKGDLIYNAEVDEKLKATNWDIATDKDGNPVIVFDVYGRVAQERSPHIYHYARWSGSEWNVLPLVESGDDMGGQGGFGGGVTLDHANPNTIYLSIKTGEAADGDIFEIERWVTADKGQTWDKTQITYDSDTKNTRPCVPRGYTGQGLALMWLHGAYRGYHGDGWDTEVRGLNGEETDVAQSPHRSLNSTLFVYRKRNDKSSGYLPDGSWVRGYQGAKKPLIPMPVVETDPDGNTRLRVLIVDKSNQRNH